MSAPTSAPLVYLMEDLCEALQVSRRTVERLRRHGAFPIPELPAIDKRPRWSKTAVDRFLEERQRTRVHGRTLHAVAGDRSGKSLPESRS